VGSMILTTISLCLAVSNHYAYNAAVKEQHEEIMRVPTRAKVEAPAEEKKVLISDRVKKVWPTCKDGDGTCDGPLEGPPTCAAPACVNAYRPTPPSAVAGPHHSPEERRSPPRLRPHRRPRQFQVDPAEPQPVPSRLSAKGRPIPASQAAWQALGGLVEHGPKGPTPRWGCSEAKASVQLTRNPILPL